LGIVLDLLDLNLLDSGDDTTRKMTICTGPQPSFLPGEQLV
jgi:hypothetical protein